jgi:hypothetical protein
LGVLVRAWVAVLLCVVLVGGVALWAWWANSSGGPEPKTGPINHVYQGTSFSENDSFGVLTYTFALINNSGSDIYVRHVGRSLPGLALIKTPEWSVEGIIGSGLSLNETITCRVTSCKKVPRGSVANTFQARTSSSGGQTLKLSLLGADTQQCQITLIEPACPGAPA